jgi:A/G-specific adenine glycosylase
MQVRIGRDLIAWFRTSQRPLPWRSQATPYAVWISEIMLQQTQAGRVIPYFLTWMHRFPDIASLAHAPQDHVLKTWEGLGYYSRARNLSRAAQILVKKYNGRLPETSAELQNLPGIGTYTAAAVASIAFSERVVAMDANVKRLLARVFDLELPVDQAKGEKAVKELAAQCMDCRHPGEFNQAMMELGALICLPRNPDCAHCPIHGSCLARARETVRHRPLKSRKEKKIAVHMATGVVFHNGLVFIQQRHDQDVWGGLWEFPGGVVEKDESPEQAVVREYLEETGFSVRPVELLTRIKHTYTKHLVTLECFVCRLTKMPGEPSLTAAQQYKWCSPQELDAFAFPAGHRKFIRWLSDQKNWEIRKIAENLF